MKYIFKKLEKSFYVLLISFHVCFGLSGCQNRQDNHNKSDSTAKESNDVFYSVFDLDNNRIIPNHLNNDISLKNSSVRLSSDDSLHAAICDYLGLDKAIIDIYGYKELADLWLLKIYAQDLSHDHLYVLLFDNNRRILDSVSSREPLNGDQLGQEGEYSIEWHYYSNFYYTNELEKVTTSCDLKILDKQIDTLYSKHCTIKYKILANKFVINTSDSIIKGCFYHDTTALITSSTI